MNNQGIRNFLARMARANCTPTQIAAAREFLRVPNTRHRRRAGRIMRWTFDQV